MAPDDERYFERIESQLDEAFAVAEEAREKGGDPTPEIEIPVAKDMADRVENILGIEGVADRVRELEGEMSREEAALELAADFAAGRVGEYETDAGKIEGAVRTAVALLTEGVVAAPIEGIDRVELAANPDGSEFVRVFYAGPIRSAGGTAQALSVLVADYTRALLGRAEYEAREAEVERYAEEVDLYDSETGLQYSPKDAETKFIARNSPVMLDGEATGQEEVSGFRDLERVATNNPRGGMCLVLAEGIAQKAPKIERYTTDLDEVDWPWLDDLIAGTVGNSTGDEADDDDPDADGADADADAEAEADGDETDDQPEPAADADSDPDGPVRPEPSRKFLRDLIAGRPVFGHPSEDGGFRLRYGRARNHGFATAGVHPATMHLVDDFLAAGTQLKTERPGKAAGVVPVDSIEGPTVRLANGDVRRIDDPAEALELRNGVEAILDLGEYLVNYGEFVENNHPLAPASYTYDWWIQEFEATDANVQALADSTRVDLEHPTPEEAIEWATEYDAPLHPEYTYCWHDITVEQFETLADAVAAGELIDGGLALEPAPEVRDALEALLVSHSQAADVLRVPEHGPFVRSLGFDPDRERTWEDLSMEVREWPNAMKAACEVAPFALRERAPTRIGGRMGRPEKSEQRELSPAVHTLFPIGEAGGNQRDVSEAAEHVHDDSGERGVVPVQVGRRECTECGERSCETRCPDCGGVTEPRYECRDCEIAVEPDESGRAECPRCGSEATPTEWRTVDVREEFHDALDAVGERENAFDMVKGVKGLTSKLKTPEPMEKGVLRAKHGVSSFKDGTVRYDMTDLPVTSVRPAELDVSVDQFRELGYHEDIDGEPLRHADQLVELRVQDVVLSNGAAEHLLRTADFVDDLLEQYYGLDSFYGFDDRGDLVGELVFGMAPHTSAAVVGRVVGFTSAAVGYAHPYFHASKRRNCDGDEDCVMLLMDGLLNFSKEYLPDKRGGSVAEDSRLVAVDPDDNVRFLTFDGFWRELESPIEADGKYRKRTCVDEGWRTYTFDETYEASLQPIEKAIRYRADEDEGLLRVTTQFGRSVEITANHSLFRYDDGIEEVAGDELSEGDLLLAPRDLDVEAERTTIDATECVDDPYVVVDDHIEDLLRSVWETFDRGSEAHDAFTSGLSYRLSKDKIAHDRLDMILDHGDYAVPNDAEIALKGSSNGITRTVDIDEEFAWLLGLFVAEGTTSSVCPAIHNADEDLIDRAGAIIETKLDHEPGRRWSNRAYELRFPAVFREVLYDLGFERRDSYAASEKVVPDPLFQAPREVVLAFLRGFIAGDGSESSDDNYSSVAFHTTSDDVRDGIVFLLHRLGLVANVSTTTNRNGNRQDIHAVSVSGGATDNPLRRVLNGDESYHPKSLVVSVPDALMEIREMPIDGSKQLIPKYLKRRENVSLEKLREIVEELDRRELPPPARDRLDELRPLVDGDLSYLRIEGIERVDYGGHLYDLQVGGEPVFLTNWLYAHNSMDAPLVMSSRIDPAEIDDEAHNMDVVDRYPREFYEATLDMADPGSVDIEIAEASVGTDAECTGFRHTHDTSDLALGPSLSAYKTLGAMTEKMDAQLELARKLRAVDETDVAERIIEYHFLPDLIGNLRAFSRQETRCLDCGTKYRRMPLTGECRECGGGVNLTVHEGSVKKYIDTATRVAEEYGTRDYTKQRLEVLDRTLESVFENDKNKQSGIADFM
jgi:DNA polymerase II large subunit